MPAHVVQPGETLWQIAQRYHTSVQEIIEANHIQQPSFINPGTILTISSRQIEISNLYLPPQNSRPRTEPITHVVIHFISNAGSNPRNPYNVQDIYRIFLNSGVSSHYLIGRNGEVYRLVGENRVAYHAGRGSLPGFPAYENRLNDYSIGIELMAIGTREEMLPFFPAETYEFISPSDIGYTDAQYRSLNLLLDEIIRRHPAIVRDRQHIVGHDEYATGRRTDPGSLFDWSRVRVIGQYVHTVRRGETLWGIAQRYGTSVNAIASWNNLNPNAVLKIGQRVLIPIKRRKTGYVVQPGDSLWKISKKFGISINALASANKLSQTAPLQPGQILTIP
ncbi:LysM peptidoglycan-binding domain-containing protein [Neobacillus notoginsengisoli]|nr:LysM peptidoglycan-binding domain-containing protein [Neobacillus notoginsengisoli]